MAKKIINFKKFFSLLIEHLQPLIKEQHAKIISLFKECNHKKLELIVLEKSRHKEELIEAWKTKKQQESHQPESHQ
jgi:hypothetical protein